MTARNPYTEQVSHIRLIWTAPLPPNGEELFLVQKIFQSLLCILLMLTPGMLVRATSGTLGRKAQKQIVELYAVGKAALLLMIVLCECTCFPLLIPFCSVFIAELFLNLLGFVLLRHYWNSPASLTRSLILLGVNFIEYCAAFAVIYLHARLLKIGDSPVTSGITTLYYSIVTSATVGYGDVVPINESGRLVAMSQILVSFVFLAVVVASFVAQLPTGLKQERESDEPGASEFKSTGSIPQTS